MKMSKISYLSISFKLNEKRKVLFKKLSFERGVVTRKFLMDGG